MFKNRYLLSLNLANNNIECGDLFEEATRINETLIDFEFGFNNFSLNDVLIYIILNNILRIAILKKKKDY